TEAAVRRFLRRGGRAELDGRFALRRADAAGTGPGAGDVTGLDAFRARIEAAAPAGQALAVRELAIDGRDVMAALSIPPGPRVGQVLERLLEEVLEDPALNVRERLLERLRSGPVP